jgi:hypothetical protein
MLGFVGFDVLAAVITNISLFWAIRPYKSVENKLGFACYLLHASFLLGLFVDSEDEGDMLIRHVSRFSTDSKTLYTRRHNS